MVKRNRLLSLLVAALMLLSTVMTGVAPAFADDTEEPTDPVIETEPANDGEENPEPAIDEPEEEIDPDLDTDGDGVPDVKELVFGTDPENADTDGDGLSDYDELYVYHTAAGDPDSDGDGLSDCDEIFVYGTDPLKGDTDSDGVSDGDELYYGTDPLDQDGDGDGIFDGDEFLLGTDPNTYDDLSAVYQWLDGDHLESELTSGNAAVPAIEGFAPFVLYREAVVAHYGVESFLNNTALIGKPVEIRMPEGGDLVLRFTVNSSAEEIAVFRMNENGTVRLDAERNGSEYTVALTENGVYYAADMHKLYVLLGFEGAGVQNLPKNSYLLEDFRYVTLNAPLSEGSGVDTDGDGIPDCEEITGQYVIDLGNGYSATVYGYASDPTLADSDFDGMRDDLDELPRSNTFSGQYTSGDYRINLSYTMNYQNFLGNNKVYNSEIASFSVWAAQFCYENEDEETKYIPNEALYDSNGSTISTVYRIDQLMRAHGMQNVIDYDLEDGYFDSDISLPAYADDNVSEVFLGHHKETIDGEDYEIISVFVRGTNGTEKEWCSNFDVGDLNRFLDDYDCVEGKQPRQTNADWNRKSNHRGFDVCATRIYRALAMYINKYVDPDAKQIFWLSGHSRGAAIANIVSASCVDEGQTVFAYTYAAPNTTANTEASAEKYDCIFNLVNGDDFVPMLPMPEWGFTRYGRTAKKYACLAESSQRSSILGKTSYSYASDSSLAELVNKFAVMSTDGWRDVYVYHCYGTSGIDHVEVHQHAGETIGSYIAGSRMDFGTDSNWNGYNEHTKKYSYCVKDKDGGFLGLGNKWSCCQTPAYAMQILAITMGNLGLSAGWEFLTSYKLADRFDFGKTSLLTNYATKIIDPHYMENYYLIQRALLTDPESEFNTLNSLYTNSSHRPVHEHTYEIVEMIQAPTCTEPGIAHVICHCSEVNSGWYDDEIKNRLIPATGHDWGTPEWTWDGVSSATATFTCGNESTHVETRSTTEITRSENGDTAIYTATVEFEGETYTGTKTVEIGYYLIGSMTNWEVDETYRFTANAAAAGEYLLNTTLAVGDEIKVVRAEGTTKLQWYPDNTGNYVVDYPHAGSVNVYFRPAGNWWNDFHTGGYFYISKLHTVTVVTDGNGEASVEPTAPDVTATVTLTATPNDGYHYDYTEIYERTGAGENDLVQIDLGALDWNETNKTFTMPDYDVVVKVYFAQNEIVREPAFMTQSLVLEGQIGVNFFVRLPQVDGYEYEGVDFTIDNVDGADASVPFSTDMPTNGSGYYQFTYYVRSIEMADTITATLKYKQNGEDKTLEKTYSVKAYFETYDDYKDLFSDKQQAMTEATADYGHYVQAFLATQRTWTLGTDYAEMDKHYADYTAADISAAQTGLADYVTDKSTGTNVAKISYTLVLDSDTEVRVYFKPATGYTGTFTFTANGETITEDGEKISVKLQSDGRYMVSIRNIAAHELANVYVIKALSDGDEASMTVSALSYVQAIMTAYADNATAVNAATAIWRYAMAAKALRP